MPERRYLRRIRAIVGVGAEEYIIENLFIRFRLRLEANPTPAEGLVEIFNLNESNETRIRERGVDIRLETAYGDDDLAALFDGTIRRVVRLRVGLDRITRIHVGGKGVVLAEQQRVLFNRTYVGITPVRTIVADGIETLGLESGPLDLIPADATETDFPYTNGDARILIGQLIEPYGLLYYVENGVVYISKYGVTADDRPEPVVISERTGMVGTPAPTDDGIRVQTLINPALTLGTRFRVESEVRSRAASGDAVNLRVAELEGAEWKIVELSHNGDNRDGPFDTVIEGRPID